jgi:hypothetical protein
VAYSEKLTYDQLLERFEKLETMVKGGVDLKDLPMRELQDKLELDWQPNPALLLGSIVQPPPGDGERVVNGGVDQATIVGSGGTVTISHGLGRTPLSAVACLTLGGSLGNGGDVEVVTGNFTAGTFDAIVQFFGGAFAGTASVSWIAFG